MKRLLAVALLAFVLVLACGKNVDKLDPEGTTWKLAASLAEKVPMLDPEKNETLAKGKSFTISVGTLFKELETNMGKNISQLNDAKPEELTAFLDRVINSMVETNVLLGAAKDKGVVVEPTQIDSVVQIFFQNNGGEERFLNILTTNGLTLDMLKNDIKRNLIKDQYLNDYVFAELEVGEEDLKQAYEEDKTASVRHILLNTQGKTDEEKAQIREKMQGLLDRAKAGEDFGKLAKEFTDDPGSKENGGLYENFPRGQMVKSFEDAAFTVPVGEISDIIETTYGYHILKVVDRKKETKSFEEVKTNLQRQLENRMRQQKYTDLIEDLKTNQKVEILFNS